MGINASKIEDKMSFGGDGDSVSSGGGECPDAPGEDESGVPGDFTATNDPGGGVTFTKTPGELVKSLLPEKIKNQASNAFRNNDLLPEMSPEDRETAAQGYEALANSNQLTGSQAALAQQYNLARAQFLRGEIPSIPGTAKEFGSLLDDIK